MKKYLSLILIITLISSLFTLQVSASAASDEDVTVQAKVLSDLGIISYEADPGKTVTRGEFATMISKTLGIEKMPAGYKLPYTDVTESSACYEGVYNLYAWRAISAAETFRPDDAITLHEALKIAVASLGYDFLALSSGGWPTGYVNAATTLGIVPRNASSTLTMAQACDMVYEMLYCKMSGMSIKGNGENDYTLKTEGTLLESTWGISVVSGIVTDSHSYGINNEKGVGEGFFAVDGMKLKSGDFDTNSYFAQEVDAYYTTDTKELRAIVCTNPDSKRVVKLLTSQDITFNNNIYTYYEADEEETAKISSDATIIYNDECIDYTKSVMVPEYGYVKLVSTTGGAADIVVIKSYEQAVAGVKVEAGAIVPDKSRVGVSYKLDDESIVFTNQNGKTAKFSDIQENSVLWIAKNSKGEINEVLICSDVVLGELTGTSKDLNTVYIDDRAFVATAEAYVAMEGSYVLGSLVRACINPDGQIVHFLSEGDASGYKVGYLMYSGFKSQGLDTAITIRILGSDNIIYTHRLASPFVMNSKVLEVNSHTYDNVLPREEEYPSSMKMDLIFYTVNRDGEITTINYSDKVAETVEGARPMGLFQNAEISDLDDKYVQYKSSTGMVTAKGHHRIFVGTGNRYYVPMPKDTGIADDEDYKVMTLSGRMPHEIHKGYTATEGNLSSDYIVSQYNLSSGSSETVDEEGADYLVTGISQIINADGEYVERLSTLTSSGILREYYSNELGFFSKYGLKFGDVVKVTADADNIVKAFHIIHRAGAEVLANYTTFTTDTILGANNFTVEEKPDSAEDPNIGLVPGIYPPIDKDTGNPVSIDLGTVLNNNPGMGTTPGCLVVLGTVYESEGEFFRVLPENYDPEVYANGGYDKANMYSFSLKGRSPLIVNLDEETVRTGTAFDLKSFKSFGDSSHKALIVYGGWVNFAVLYE